MNLGKNHPIPALAAFVVAALSLTIALAAPASARKVLPSGGQFVNVSVGFQSQIPLSEISDKTLLSAQHAGRTFIYRMVSKECAVLKETIARTCRLTSLNVSAQVRDRSNRGPIKLFLNGTAQYAITLRDKAVD